MVTLPADQKDEGHDNHEKRHLASPPIDRSCSDGLFTTPLCLSGSTPLIAKGHGTKALHPPQTGYMTGAKATSQAKAPVMESNKARLAAD